MVRSVNLLSCLDAQGMVHNPIDSFADYYLWSSRTPEPTDPRQGDKPLP